MFGASAGQSRGRVAAACGIQAALSLWETPITCLAGPSGGDGVQVLLLILVPVYLLLYPPRT
jgi:hypothetical protein